MSRGAARVGVVAALLVLGAGIGQVTGSQDGAARTPPVPVVGATAVCPETPVTVGSLGSGAGWLRARALDAASAALPLTAAGSVLAGVEEPVVAARGAVAAGLGAEHVRPVDSGPVRGLTAVRCTAPAGSTWFVGGGTVLGQATELVLVNAEGEEAAVDVRGWSSDGPVEERPGRGLAVPPRSRVVVPVDLLAPDRDLLALHVTTRRGRAAAYLRTTRRDGRIPQGTDWVPATQAPARALVVPGLPRGPGRRYVVLVNPGAEDAAASLVLVTGDGQLTPQPLDVLAGSTVAVEVSEQLADVPAAAVVTADQPLAASGLVYDLQDGPVRELSYAAAATPLTGPALLADVTLAAPAEQTLLVSAPEGDAVVEVVPVPVLRPGGSSAGELPPSRRVEVPAGTTATLRLSTFVEPGATARLAFEVRPVSGRAYASRYLRERGRTGPLTAVLPVVPARREVPWPRVAPD